MSEGGGERGRTPWLEIAIGGAGALVLLLMVGYLLHDAFGGGDERPVDIVLERGEATERSGAWHLPVRVRNLGDRPAEAVGLRAELALPGGAFEEAALTLSFLPPRGTIDAAFLFERDPDGGELRLRVTGYVAP